MSEIDRPQEEKLGREEFGELFLIQVRGTIATAFVFSGTVPGQEDWDILRGLVEPTMRQVGEIGHRTGYNMFVQLREAGK